MPKATIDNSIDPSAASTRRSLLQKAASVAVGGAVLAATINASGPAAAAQAGLAEGADPVFAAIDAHRTASAAYDAIIERVKGLPADAPTDHLLAAPCDAEIDALDDLVGLIPETMAGLVAWIGYLNAVMEADEHRFHEGHFAVFLPSLAEAISVAVSS